MYKTKETGLLPPLVRDALLSIMVSKKITRQAAFAKSLKLSSGYVCDVLALRRNLSPDVIERIAKVYSLTRKQANDLTHRAACVAGWALAPLPVEDRVEIVKAEAGVLMRNPANKGKAKKVAKAKVKKVKAAKPKKAATSPKPVPKKAKPKPAPKKTAPVPKKAKAITPKATSSVVVTLPVMPEPVAQPAPDERDDMPAAPTAA